MANDIVFTVRARDEVSKSLDRINAKIEELRRTSGGADKRIEGLEQSATRLKRTLARMEHETTDARQAMAKLKTESSQIGTNFRRVSAAVDDSNRSMTSNAAAINAAERQMEQMNDVTRRYSNRVQTATARTGAFRRAQGRLATNIRNSRTIMYAFSGLLGVGGAGFIGRITTGARETTLMAEALGTNAEALFANRQEYEKIGKTATDYKNVLTNLIIAQGEALTGSERHIKVFEKLGLTMDEVAKMDAATLYDTIKEGSDQGILSATDLNVFLRKESIATFRQVKQGSTDLTNSQIEDAANVAKGWDEAMANLEESAIEAISAAEQDLLDFIKIIERGATFVLRIVTNPSDSRPDDSDASLFEQVANDFIDLLQGDIDNLFNFGDLWEALTGNYDTSPTTLEERAAMGDRHPLYQRYDSEFSEAFRGQSPQEALQVIASGDLTQGQRELLARIDAENNILGATRAGLETGRQIVRDSEGSPSRGGGGSGTLDRSADRSKDAFARAFDTAGVRAVRNAIQSSDFTLAREEAEALHELRSTAASQLETAGEQFQAQQAADFALLDSLADIGEAESDYFEESLEEMRKQTADLIDIRNNTRSAKQIAIDTAREAFAGTTLEQPFEDLIAGEEQVNRALILQAARILTDFEANGIFTDALLGFRQIPGSDAGVDDYGNADALGILFTRALEAIVGDDATNIFSAAGGLFSQFGLGQFGNIPTEGLTAPTPVVEIQTIPIHITVEVPPVPLGDAISFVEDVVREALVTHTVRV